MGVAIEMGRPVMSASILSPCDGFVHHVTAEIDGTDRIGLLRVRRLTASWVDDCASGCDIDRRGQWNPRAQ